MTDTLDNQFSSVSAGAADWDSDVNRNTGISERGYHVTQRAGIAVNTGMALWCNSAGFVFPFDPNSTSIRPFAMAYTAAASGDTINMLAWGIVRSLAINSAVLPGAPAWVSAATPGVIVGSSAVQNYPVGLGLPGYGVMFSPARGSSAGAGYTPTYFSNSLAINAVVGSLHTFTFSLGALQGWNRRVRANASSGSNIEIKFYADAARTDLQYSTISGGISVVNSFHDRAGWPFDTNSGTLYGTCMILSGDVSSAAINIQGQWEY
jgi:hypothetical protein